LTVLGLQAFQQAHSKFIFSDCSGACNHPFHHAFQDATSTFNLPKLIGGLQSSKAKSASPLLQLLLQHTTIVSAAGAHNVRGQSGPVHPNPQQGLKAFVGTRHTMGDSKNFTSMKVGSQAHNMEHMEGLLKGVLDGENVHANGIIENIGTTGAILSQEGHLKCRTALITALSAFAYLSIRVI
jgi:hypothetical protein